VRYELAMVLAASLLPWIVGCGSEPEGPKPAAPTVPSAAPTAVSAQEGAKKAPPPPPPPAPSPSEFATPKPRDPNEPPPGMVREKAAVGVGAAGRGYDTNVAAAPVTVPIGAFFTSKERVAFEIHLPKAMQLYKGEKGYAPRTHQEFMQNVIKANDIHLPELPPGHRYVYDPKQEQLMVERPR
jgi:hypothetical protein